MLEVVERLEEEDEEWRHGDGLGWDMVIRWLSHKMRNRKQWTISMRAFLEQLKKEITLLI